MKFLVKVMYESSVAGMILGGPGCRLQTCSRLASERFNSAFSALSSYAIFSRHRFKLWFKPSCAPSRSTVRCLTTSLRRSSLSFLGNASASSFQLIVQTV